jgi:hypothetical protein
MYFHSGSFQPIDNWSRQKQMGLHHAERGGENSNRNFLCTGGVSDEFFVFSRFMIQQSNSNPLPSIAKTRGACIRKKIIKPSFKMIPMKISSFYHIYSEQIIFEQNLKGRLKNITAGETRKRNLKGRADGLILELNRSLLNREYTLMNVLKALASIISMYNLYVTLLSKITAPLHRKSRGADHIENIVLLRTCMLRALRSNGRCLQSHGSVVS